MRPDDFTNASIRRAIEQVAKHRRQENSDILRSASIPINKQIQAISEAQRKQILTQLERAVEQSRPEISTALAEQRAQQVEYLRKAIGPIDLSTIARAATEQLRLASTPAIKQVALAAIRDEALQNAARTALERTHTAIAHYDWEALSRSLGAEAKNLLAEIGAEDRFDELQRAAKADVATAREERSEAREEGDEQAADAHREATEDELPDLVAELITEVREQGRATREAIAEGPARDAVDYISLVFEIVTVLLTIAAVGLAIATYRQGEAPPQRGPTIVIEVPDRPSEQAKPPDRKRHAERSKEKDIGEEP